MEKKNGLLSNLSWKFAERISAQMVTFIVSIILARILEPSHYGTISIVMIFIALANVFVSEGLGSGLIQKKDADALDFSSILYFNICFSVILYLLLFFCAPFISQFYGSGYEILTPVLRILGLRIIITGVNSVQQAYVSKNMLFRKFFLSTLIGTIISAIVGVGMAVNGFGVWALVSQYLTNEMIGTIVLGISIGKSPLLAFSYERLKSLLNYSLKILVTGLLITGYQELRALIIGKIYSSADLAYYDKSRQFPSLIVTNIDTSIGAVLFPKMSLEQDDINVIRNTTRNSIRFSAYIMCPLMLGLAAVSENFVKLILTDKWLPCVPLMQMFCIIYLFQPIHTANMQAIKALGRSDIYLKLEIFKKVIELISLIMVMWISVTAIVINMAVLTTLFTFVNAYPNKKLLKYNFWDQMRDILPVVCMSIFMASIVIIIGEIHLPTIIVLILQIIVGGVIYLLQSIVTKNREFLYIVKFLKVKML
jgi:O-antigen/teichoic acid export membrane protein